MQPLYVDISEIAEEFQLDKETSNSMVDYTIKEVTGEFARMWEEQAKKELGSTREQYIKSLVVVDEGRLQGSVVLRGKFPNMIEQGVGAFDMKPHFKNSPKAKTTKDGGWYLTIPFRFAGSDSLGESEVFTGQMPQEIHKLMKQKPVDSSSGRSEPLKPNEIPQNFNQPKVRYAVSNLPESKTFQEYKNKTSLYQGITKVQDQKTGQNRFVSFRRVSDESEPSSWIHSGINAYKLAEKALQEMDMDATADVAADNFLNSIGF